MTGWLGPWRRGPALAPEIAARLAAWRTLAKADLALPIEQGRYVVVDVESTGLDMRRDRLIAIGAVAVVDGRIQLADAKRRPMYITAQEALWEDPIQMPLVAIRKYQVFNRRVRNMYVAFSDFNTGLREAWLAS